MESRLEAMINQNKLKIDQFFIMHPFAIHEKKIYKEALYNIDFFRDLFVESNKTFERLSTLCNVIDNHEKNLLVITGYRGCGKTNFVRFVKNLAEGNHALFTMENTLNYELSMIKDSDVKKEIRYSYEQSKKKITTGFFEVKDEIEGKIETQKFVDFLENKIKSKVEYINFDEVSLGSKRPITEALYYILRRKIITRIENGSYTKVVDIIDNFISDNKLIIEEGFEEIDFGTFKDFWTIVRVYMYLITNSDDVSVLLEELKKLKLEQLLFSFTIFDYAEMIADGKDVNDQKLLYILDNIDIISNDSSAIFQNGMMGVWKFLWDSRNVFSRIDEAHKNNPFVRIFEKTNVVVVMRETTAMHITGHLRDKMRGIMEHFDMSPDINKNLIIQKRLDLAIRLIKTGKIENNSFILAIDLLKKLTGHDVLMKELFALFNNDYRTAIACLVTILKENLEEIRKAIAILDSENQIVVNGGKGIIYRLLFEAFYDWRYFEGMGIPSRRSIEGKTLLKDHETKYSFARVLLTVLCKRQIKIPERFFVNPEESVKFSELYEMLSTLIDLDDMIDIMDALYSLSNKRFWNHLLTFDNIFHYSPDIIRKYIKEKRSNPSGEDIYIRVTTAGQMFVELISPHFEFFACRYASIRQYSLFHYNNIDDENQLKNVKTIINDVFSMVLECTNNLEKYNLAIMKIDDGATKYSHIVGSPYYFQSQFHEERIIHTHITYLEAYRQFIGEISPKPKKYMEVNEYLLEVMSNYLLLLRYDPNNGIKEFRDHYISENSKKLFNELNVCIEKIRNSPNLSRSISVTRDYYLAHYKGELCQIMQKEGETYVY